MSRNVRELYTALCRHYRPRDEIYLFGFSRGAHTIRTLTAFIATCGVIDAASVTQRDLKKRVGEAYRAFRKHFRKVRMEEAIHVSTFERIEPATHGYAPGNLPREFAVVTTPPRAKEGREARVSKRQAEQLAASGKISDAELMHGKPPPEAWSREPKMLGAKEVRFWIAVHRRVHNFFLIVLAIYLIALIVETATDGHMAVYLAWTAAFAAVTTVVWFVAAHARAKSDAVFDAFWRSHRFRMGDDHARSDRSAPLGRDHAGIKAAQV